MASLLSARARSPQGGVGVRNKNDTVLAASAARLRGECRPVPVRHRLGTCAAELPRRSATRSVRHRRPITAAALQNRR